MPFNHRLFPCRTVSARRIRESRSLHHQFKFIARRRRQIGLLDEYNFRLSTRLFLLPGQGQPMTSVRNSRSVPLCISQPQSIKESLDRFSDYCQNLPCRVIRATRHKRSFPKTSRQKGVPISVVLRMVTLTRDRGSADAPARRLGLDARCLRISARLLRRITSSRRHRRRCRERDRVGLPRFVRPPRSVWR